MLNPDEWVLEHKDGLVPLSKWQKTVDVMSRVFSAPAGFIVQYSPEGYQVVISSQQETNPYPPGGVIPEETNIFCKHVVQSQQPLYVQEASKDSAWDDNPEVVDDGFESYLGLPVKWPNGKPFGTICVMDFKPTDYESEYVDLISELRDLVEADLVLIHQYLEASSLAMTDELTGLFNRRGFQTIAQQYLMLAGRSGKQLGLVYLDLNGLKGINDREGHTAGDEALKLLASSIKEVVRENDLSARLSGDEFAILAMADSEQELEAMTRRVKARLAETSISTSCGSVMIDDVSQPLEYWLRIADQRMYQDKQSQ